MITKRINGMKKGQTAIEMVLILLFILLAVSTIMNLSLAFNSKTELMAETRALAQGVAAELSINGTTTHLIRIDENVTSGELKADIYMVSEDCNKARNLLTSSLSQILGINPISLWRCYDKLFDDTVL